jgi:type VI secretion system secreted protein Hcp
MAVDIFLKIDDVSGESVDAKYKGWIEVLSFAIGASQSAAAHSGSLSGWGKVDLHDIDVHKYTDRSTPKLLAWCGSGRHLKNVRIVARKAGGKPLEYITVTLEDAIIASVTLGSKGTEERLTEDVTLNFKRIRYEYVPQRADGSGDASIPMGWDVAANKEF